jgi:hypothetical protein
VGRGDTTSFWEDVWIGHFYLASQFPRLFALESNKVVWCVIGFREVITFGIGEERLEGVWKNLNLIVFCRSLARFKGEGIVILGCGILMIKKSLLSERFGSQLKL